jgi:Tfp pilus assembly protein PilV
MKKINYQDGFSLLETLIAVFLVTLAIVTFLGSAARGITGTHQAFNRVRAQLLAQEGLEIVRNIRDNQMVASPLGSTLGILAPNYCSINGCTFDISSIDSMSPVDPSCGLSSPCAKLQINSNGLYTHSGNASTPFSRVITIKQSASPGAADVTSTVRWVNGVNNDSVTVVTHLTNWFSQPPAAI